MEQKDAKRLLSAVNDEIMNGHIMIYDMKYSDNIFVAVLRFTTENNAFYKHLSNKEALSISKREAIDYHTLVSAKKSVFKKGFHHYPEQLAWIEYEYLCRQQHKDEVERVIKKMFRDNNTGHIQMKEDIFTPDDFLEVLMSGCSTMDRFSESKAIGILSENITIPGFSTGLSSAFEQISSLLDIKRVQNRKIIDNSLYEFVSHNQIDISGESSDSKAICSDPSLRVVRVAV